VDFTGFPDKRKSNSRSSLLPRSKTIGTGIINSILSTVAKREDIENGNTLAGMAKPQAGK